MWEMNDIVHIEYKGHYTYFIKFDDGLQGKVDLTEYLDKGPVFEPLKDEDIFKSARIEGGTLSWSNGADIAPETLYEKIENIHNKELHQTP